MGVSLAIKNFTVGGTFIMRIFKRAKKKEDFDNLINVAKYADFGRSTAIQAAFCMGYDAGKDGADNE